MDEKKSKDTVANIMSWIKSTVIALIIALAIKNYVVTATAVSGNSMKDTLHNNDRLIVTKLGTRAELFKRGDIIILQSPINEEEDFIKRIIGLPGDFIQIVNGEVYINGTRYKEDYTNVKYTNTPGGVSEWYVADDEVFVMGDNRAPGGSNDSRMFGPIKISTVRGIVLLRFYPFEDIEILRK